MPVPTPASTAHDDPKLTETAILHLLVRNYPAHFSDSEIVSQIARNPDHTSDSIFITDALRQLQADQLIRRHSHFWAATMAAVKAYALLEA